SPILPHGAVAAPMHGAGISQTAEGLGGHGAFHGVEVGELVASVDRSRDSGGSQREQCVEKRVEIDGDGARGNGAVRITKVPRQVVLIAENVTAGAGSLAIAGESRGIVEEGTAVNHRFR